MEEKKEKKAKINVLRGNIIEYVTTPNRKGVSKMLDELANTIAEISTDIAIKATTDQFVARIKAAATEGAAQAKGDK